MMSAEGATCGHGPYQSLRQKDRGKIIAANGALHLLGNIFALSGSWRILHGPFLRLEGEKNHVRIT